MGNEWRCKKKISKELKPYKAEPVECVFITGEKKPNANEIFGFFFSTQTEYQFYINLKHVAHRNSAS